MSCQAVMDGVDLEYECGAVGSTLMLPDGNIFWHENELAYEPCIPTAWHKSRLLTALIS